MLPPIPLKYALPLGGLTASAFVFNTSEFMPVALLSDISASFAMTPAETGLMITVYAWMVGVLSLPLMLLAARVPAKRLLLVTLALFAAGQVLAGLAQSFAMLMGARLVVASAHAIFWSIAAPFGTRLVTREHQPFAISAIATGSAIAMVFGLPLGRVVGLALGWRMTFLLIGAIAFIALLYLARVFPPLPARGQTFALRDLPALLESPAIFGILIMSVLFATGYFTTYSYIEPFLGEVAGFSPTAITGTLVLYGGSGFLGSVIFSRFYGGHRRAVCLAGLAVSVPLLTVLLPVSSLSLVCVPVLMGVSLLATLFNVTMQAELVRHTSLAAAPIATALFSGIFNVGIGSGTFLGGRLAAHGLLAFVALAGAALVLLAALYCRLRYLGDTQE